MAASGYDYKLVVTKLEYCPMQYPPWKALLKGFFDTEGARQRLLVTGSARLDLYRRGGDSMVGRYVGYRLDGALADPAVLADPERWGETEARSPLPIESLLTPGRVSRAAVRRSERRARRWRVARREQVLHQDLRDLTHVRQVALVEQGVTPAEAVPSPRRRGG